MSDFSTWTQKPHAKDYLLFPENIGPYLSIDETALSKGELYTIITNKYAKGHRGSIVAIFYGTKVEVIVEKLRTISDSLRRKVKEVTLDMASSMKKIVSRAFPYATQVTDRFHVQKLALEALQNIRIEYRWQVLEQENTRLQEAKAKKETYVEIEFGNGDTRRELLVRSRYLLYKCSSKWTESQSKRADILFREYPKLKKAYKLANQLRAIYNQNLHPKVAMTKLAHWYKDVEDSGLNNFNTVMNTIQANYKTIINYFNNRSTNAAAESFNAKIKAFRAQFRGVRNTDFFLFRLTKIFA